MRKFLLILAVLCSTVSAWAQTEKVTTINPDKWYQLKCIASDDAHGNGANVWLSDNGTAFAGKSATATFFTFESADGGKYYIKSNASGKYVGASDTKVVQEETPATAWTVGTINEEGYVYISSSTNNYLNNAAGDNNIQIKNHGSGVSSGNPCSLWYLTEYEPTPSSPAAESLLRISEGLLDTQENGQYKWTSPTLAAPAGGFNKIRVTFLKTSNNEKPAGFPCVAIAEFYLYDKDGNEVALTENNFSSNATHVGEGSIAELCDGATSKQDGEGDNDWYWHSQWSGTPNPYGYHYLEINVTGLEADLSEYKIGWVTRRAQASPAEVIISAGATTEAAAKNANIQMLPEVSTDGVKLYTIKNVRSKNYLRYSEESTKPVQNSAIANESYWYFTQGTDGKVVVHNAVSGKVLGTNYEMSTSGEWFVSPSPYRPGLVFSKEADYSQDNSSMDSQNSGNGVGDWKHVAGDNEGTAWLVEEVTIDFPALSLKNMKISSIGAAVKTIEVNKWYILNNVGRGNYVSQEGNDWKMRPTGDVVDGDMAEDKAGYLFKITKNGEYYNIMSGNGKYFQLGRNTASTSAKPVNFQIDVISGDNFYLYDKDHGYAADGQETNNAFVGWSTSVPANAGGNDSYLLLPVELFDLGEIGVLKSELSEAINNAQNMYNSVKGSIGEGVGKYIAPADIETKFAAIVTFCENINENTTPEAINAKMAELEALIASVQLNMPIAGKFYRMHNDNKYITSGVTDAGRIALSETNNDAASVYYYDGTHLLAYGTGLYMGLNKDDWTFEAVGSTDISAIQFVAAVNGAVAKYNIKSADRWLHRTNDFVNRCTNNTCGDAHNWTLEEVTWLPVPMNTDLGYATLYSPVELNLSYNRVKAYTATINESGNAITLTEQSVVPANTGVVLEYQEGAEIENGCVYLQIKETTLTNVESQLCGTLADSYVAGDGYILAKPEEYKTGFYKAMKNFTVAANGTGTKVAEGATGTHFLNNGFKAYLPKPASSEARFYVFDFGTETAIENIEGAKSANDAVIYDLAGRRVQNALKGLYIVNGKKVIK